MEFPISRERLQNYRANEADAVERKKRISEEIKIICRDVEIKVLRTNERSYVYRMSDRDSQRGLIHPIGPINPKMSPQMYFLNQKVLFVNGLLEAIKNTFTDCTITMDPLETYIIINWS
jgi:hypothetical protein